MQGQLQQLDVLPRQLSHPRSPTRGAQQVSWCPLGACCCGALLCFAASTAAYLTRGLCQLLLFGAVLSRLVACRYKPSWPLSQAAGLECMQEPGTLFSASSTEGAAQRQQEPLEGSRSSTERMGKRRGWSGRLGEQFTSVLDTLSKGESLWHPEVRLLLQSTTLSSPSLYPLHLRKQLHAMCALHVEYAFTGEEHLGWWVVGLLPHQIGILVSAAAFCTLPPEDVACCAGTAGRSRSQSWPGFVCVSAPNPTADFST